MAVANHSDILKDEAVHEDPTQIIPTDSIRASSESGINLLKNALAGTVAFSELGVNWPIVIWIAMVHVMAIAAVFFFSWAAFVTCIVLAFATGSVGVCMGYHRLLTHQSFKTYRPIRWLLAFLGGLSGEGSALTWVAQHRKHHAFSDHEGDPHSPKDGGWWSHFLWFMPDFGRKWHKELLSRYAPDMVKDKVMVVLHHLFLPSHFALGVGLFLLGYFGPQSLGLGSAWAGGLDVVLGLGCADGLRTAHHLVCELRHPSVGLPELRNLGRQPQPVVGRYSGLGRRVAQQPPRLPTRREHGPSLVGN